MPQFGSSVLCIDREVWSAREGSQRMEVVMVVISKGCCRHELVISDSRATGVVALPSSQVSARCLALDVMCGLAKFYLKPDCNLFGLFLVSKTSNQK